MRGPGCTTQPGSPPTRYRSPQRLYYDDMYVPRQFSVETAAQIRGLLRSVTSEYEHDGLRLSRGAVLDRLIGMVRGYC